MGLLRAFQLHREGFRSSELEKLCAYEFTQPFRDDDIGPVAGGSPSTYLDAVVVIVHL